MFGRKNTKIDALASQDTRHQPEPLVDPDEDTFHVYACAPDYTPSAPVSESPYNDGGKLSREMLVQDVADEVFQAIRQSIDECPESYPTLVDSWDVTQASIPRKAIELMYDGVEVIIHFELRVDPDIVRPDEEDEDGE